MWAMLIPSNKDTILRTWNQLWPFFFMMIWMICSLRRIAGRRGRTKVPAAFSLQGCIPDERNEENEGTKRRERRPGLPESLRVRSASPCRFRRDAHASRRNCRQAAAVRLQSCGGR